MLNDEQLWAKCGSGQRITFEDMGLDPTKHRNGTQIHREGFEISEGVSLCYNIGMIILTAIGVVLLVMTLI